MQTTLTVEHPGTLTVPGRAHTEQRILSARLGGVHPAVVPTFYPSDLSDAGVWEFGLLSSERVVSTQTLRTQIGDTPWQFAKATHLLAFAESFPAVHRAGRIVALGQHEVVDTRSPKVMILSNVGGERHLGLALDVGPWYPTDLFLLVMRPQT